MAEREQVSTPPPTIGSAVGAVLSALLMNRPDLYARFQKMLAAGKLVADTEIILALATNPLTLSYLNLLLSTAPEELVRVYQDWTGRSPTPPPPEATPAPPDSTAGKERQPAARAPLDVAALVGDSPYQPPTTFPPRPVLYAQLGHTFVYEGNQHQQKGQLNQARSAYLRAVEAFREALRRAPDRPDLYLYLADAHERLGQEAEALRLYVGALPLLPEQATPLLSRIHQMLAPELAPALAEQWESLEALASSPNLSATAHPRIEILLARLALYQNDTKATLTAIAYFDRALAHEPDNLFALEGKGEALRRLGQAEEAATLLQQAVTGSDAWGDEHRQTATRLKLAQILIDLQRWEEARPLIDQGLQGDPTLRPQLLLALGWCHLARGEAEQARALAEEVLAAAGADQALRVEAYTQRAGALLQLGEYSGANEDARTALDLAPNHPQALRIRAEALIHDPVTPDVEKGIQLLQIYLRNNPGDATRLSLLVEALRQAGRPASAIVEALEQGLPGVSGEPQKELLMELAAAYLEEGRPEMALETLNRVPRPQGEAAERTPGRWDWLVQSVWKQDQFLSRWWWLDGAARAKQGNLDQALESYNRAVSLDAGNVPLIEEHAELLAQSGRLDAALALWQTVGAVPGERGRAALEMAHLYRQREQWLEALDALDTALAEELETDQRQAALELKCRVAEEAARPSEEVAQAYLDAGRFYYDNNQIDNALEALQKARALDPELALAGWYLADALLIKSYLADPPYVDRQRIEDALAVWEETARVEQPGTDILWPLLTRAYIAERLAYLPGAPFLTLLSQATLLVERAILRQGGAYYLAALARFHRALENYATAFAAAARAYEDFPDVDFIADEYALCLAHVGRYEEAEAIIARRENLQPADWLASIHAYVLGQQNHLEEAIAQLTAIAEATPSDLWVYSYRGDCYRRLDVKERAREDYDGVWQQRAREDYAWAWQQRGDPRYSHAGNLGLFGPAGYALAVLTPGLDEPLLREAASLLAEYTGFSASAPYAHQMLGLCYLALGKLDDAERHLRRGITLAGSIRFLDDFLRDEIQPLEPLVEAWPHAAAARDLLAKAAGWIQEQRAALTPPLEPAQELERFLARLPVEESRLSWTWMGIQAGIARLHGEAGDWQRAAERYQQLRLAGELFGVFPESEAGIANAVAGLLQQGDDFLLKDELDKATEQYHAASRLIEETGSIAVEQRVDVHARLGYAAFHRGERDAAQAHFTRAVDTRSESLLQATGSRVGEVCRHLLLTGDDFLALTAYWQELADDPAVEQQLRQALKVAIHALAAFHEDQFRLTQAYAESTGMYPVVTPIAVELSADLVPDDTENWSLLKELIPALRERIKARFGVEIPGVRVRGNEGDLPPHTYLFMLDEIPLLLGELDPDRRFCSRPLQDAATLDVPAEELRAGADPVTGEEGCWVPLTHAGRLVEAGLPLWQDPLAYMVRHLEALLQNHLSRYLGVQEVTGLLESWRQDARGAALVQSALPDEASRLCFVWLLQALLEEKAPITDWQAILHAVTETGLPDRDVSAPLQAVRLALRAQLPGNQPGAIQLALPPTVETTVASWLQHENGAPFLALPPEETQEALAEVRELLAPYEDSRNLALVVSRGELRLPVRRLIALEFPEVAVLSGEEALPGTVEEVEDAR